MALISEVEYSGDVEAQLRQVLQAEEYQAHRTQTVGEEGGTWRGVLGLYGCLDMLVYMCSCTFICICANIRYLSMFI